MVGTRDGQWAGRNRRWLADREILAVTLMCSPGAGRTALLERTIRELGGEVAVSVVESERRSVFGAERVRATGARVIEAGTGPGRHLDAAMLATTLRRLDPPSRSLLFVDHVGNLLDLGEHSRVVIMSVTERADKPVAYPHLFHGVDLVLLNKADLLGEVDFDVAGLQKAVARVNPPARVLPVSAVRGDGLPDWYGWLRRRHGRSILSSP